VHSVERIYLRQWCFNASKPCVAASIGAQYQYVGFSRRNKIPRCSAYAMGESNPVPASGLISDLAQKLISSSISRHLSTRKMLSKSMHMFLSNLANRQTHRQTSCDQSHLPPPLSEVKNCLLGVYYCWQLSKECVAYDVNIVIIMVIASCVV